MWRWCSGAFRAVARSEGGLGSSSSGEWKLTQEDLLGPGFGGTGEPRFLGRLSRHRLELMLERVGILPALRARGFRRPTLSLDAGPTGETLRIVGGERRSEVLIELRVNRSRRVVPEMEVLFIEWLLLQNPRERFTERRPRLPGQGHPGLGLLREVLAWLVVLCEALELDGIAFLPAHFYTAALGRRHLRFLDPRHQARFEELAEAVSGFSLGAASHMIEQGRVRDGSTGEPVSWQPAPMVLAVSERLRRVLSGDRYDAARAEARGRLRYLLA